MSTKRNRVTDAVLTLGLNGKMTNYKPVNAEGHLLVYFETN